MKDLVPTLTVSTYDCSATPSYNIYIFLSYEKNSRDNFDFKGSKKNDVQTTSIFIICSLNTPILQSVV